MAADHAIARPRRPGARGRPGISALALAGLVAFVALAAGAASAMDCTVCHREGRPSDATGLRDTEPALCLACHPDRQGDAEHLVGVIPTGPKPDGLPLPEGRLNCTTCHDPHGSPPGALRLPPPRLCIACHPR